MSPSSSAPASPAPDAKLVKEAMAVNKKQFEVESTLFKIGGYARGTRTPTVLKEVMMGSGLAATEDMLNNVHEAGLKWQSGDVKRYGAKIADVELEPGMVLAITQCEDGRAMKNKRRDGKITTGRLVRITTYFSRDKDGVLKVSKWDGKQVPTCA